MHLPSEFRQTYNGNTILLSCGITSALELYMVGDDMTTLNRLELTELTHLAPVEVQPMPIRQGQIWLKHHWARWTPGQRTRDDRNSRILSQQH